MALWYNATLPGQVSITLNQTTVWPVALSNFAQSRDGSIQVLQYDPGTEFYPVTSTGGDHFRRASTFKIYSDFDQTFFPPTTGLQLETITEIAIIDIDAQWAVLVLQVNRRCATCPLQLRLSDRVFRPRMYSVRLVGISPKS